jgi:transposase
LSKDSISKQERSNTMLHVGIDMHKHFSEATAVDDAGKVIVHQKLFHDNREQMVEFFSRLPPDSVATVEATRNWYWLYELIENQKLGVKLAHPQKVRLIAEAKTKTDKIDAWTLAQLERTGFLPEAYIPPREVRDQREALRCRIALVRARAMFKNRIHAILDKLGIGHKFTDLFGKAGLAFLKKVELRPIYRLELNCYLDVLDYLEQKVDEATKMIRDLLKPDPRVKLLMTIPGIGELTAYLLLSEIGDIKRFKNAKKLASYVGIVPRVRQSAEHCWQGRITKEGNSYMRWAIVEAAQLAPRQDPALMVFFQRIEKKSGAKKGRVAVGRKLLVAVWYVLTYGQEYRYGYLANDHE